MELDTAQEIKFSFKEKSLMENFIFLCGVIITGVNSNKLILFFSTQMRFLQDSHCIEHMWCVA